MSTYIPVLHDRVEAYDQSRRAWRPGRIVQAPLPGGYRFVVQPDDAEVNIECSAFELRLLAEPDSLPPVDERFEDATPPYLPRTRTRDEITADLKTDPAQAEKHAAKLLGHFTDDFDCETPGRFIRALRELTIGYEFTDGDIGSMMKTFPRGDADTGIVIVRDMPFASLCEHHVLPFTGIAHVAYLPSDRIVGLSKIPRLLRAVTRRLQVQERIGATIADALMKHVAALGAMVVIRSQHTCMALRGVECPGSMVTSTVRGVFAEKHEARSEVLSLLG